MVEHNPPKHDPDMPNHEHYATEGHTKMYRPKQNEIRQKQLYAGSGAHEPTENQRKEHLRTMKEHELPHWAGRDHS